MSTINRAQHLAWLSTITQIPTAAGREGRVIAWIERWTAERPELAMTKDGAGNLLITLRADEGRSEAPVVITAHLDHPAFVVERVIAPAVVEMSFRGGVMDVFFEDAPITVYTKDDRRVSATLTGLAPGSSPAGKHYLAELSEECTDLLPGDVARWALPAASVEDDLFHTDACDDLSAVAAAVSALDVLRGIAPAERAHPVQVLFTRAEEIGFIGAIAACRLGTIARGARVVNLENSRAFPESPIGAGPIVRVGDRLTVFSPSLTASCAKRAEEVLGGPASPTATQTKSAASARPWQRKLMSGGACESSVFCAAGYDATCLCLPLGNYHNMTNLTEHQEGRYDRAALGPARCGREFISVTDYHALVDLLIGIGQRLPAGAGVHGLVEKLYSEKAYVLG